MIKFKCDFTGVESEWCETDALPVGWGIMNVNFKGSYSARLHACPDIVKKFDAKHQNAKDGIRMTLGDMIEQHIVDITTDATADALDNLK